MNNTLMSGIEVTISKPGQSERVTELEAESSRYHYVPNYVRFEAVASKYPN